MTVQELINRLQELDPQETIRFMAEIFPSGGQACGGEVLLTAVEQMQHPDDSFSSLFLRFEGKEDLWSDDCNGCEEDED